MIKKVKIRAFVNGAVEHVPGGAICIGRLASEAPLVF